jgi:hypothetical protein
MGNREDMVGAKRCIKKIDREELNMMQNMMPGMEAYMFFWIVLAILVSLLLIGICAWLIAHWLKKQRASTIQLGPQPHNIYQEYEQGYQPQPQAQPAETYQEGGESYGYPQAQYEQQQTP